MYTKNRLVNAPDLFLTLLLICWILILLAIPVIGYLGETWTSVLSFFVDDGWCQPPKQGLGVHCFGDFGFPYQHAINGTAYSTGSLGAANTPLSIFLFELLSQAHYNVALIFVQILMIAGFVGTVYWGSLARNIHTRLMLVLLVGVGSVGSIVAIDRSNWVGFLAPLILLFVVFIDKRLWIRASVVLVLIAGLKFWGIVFVVGLIAKKQFKYALLCFVLTPLSYLFFFAAAERNKSLFEKMRLTFEAITDKEYSSLVSKYGVSIYSGLVRINCSYQDAGGCDFNRPSAYLDHSMAIAMICAAILALWACASMIYFARNRFLAYTPLISLGFLAVPDAPAYNLVFALPAVALLFRWLSADLDRVIRVRGGTKQATLEYRLTVCLMATLIFSVVPIPLWSFGENNDSMLGYWRLSNLIVPSVWIIVVVFYLFVMLKGVLSPHDKPHSIDDLLFVEGISSRIQEV